jgi:hypothetical protein
MELIIMTDEVYHLVEVTKQMMVNIKLYNTSQINCFDLCDILRLKLTTYHDYPFNQHIMNDGSGYFYGCICK